jgi:tetratricopeptide (TPR) repeat protein
VVTSRGQLTELVVSDGARPLIVDLLGVDDARGLLAERLGVARVERETGAVDRIVEACGRLPLALAVVAARGALNPGFSLADIAGELTGSGTAALAGVRTAFSWSYRQLHPDAQRLFRLAGQHQGPDLTAPIAAALGGLDVMRAARILDELARARLVVEHRLGRFACHDLLRAYAQEISRITDPEADRRAATERLLDHLVHAAGAATLVLDPLRKPIGIPAGDPPATVTRPADEAAAMVWFRAEQRVLLTALDLAVRTGLDRRAWQLAWGIVVALERDGGWQDWIAAQAVALRAAERLGDLGAQAFSRRSLAVGHVRLGRTAEAKAHGQAGYELFLRAGDPAGAAVCRHAMAFACETEGGWADAIAHAEQALELFRQADDPIGQARALNSAGLYRAELGDLGAALADCEQALRLQLTMNDPGGAGSTLDSLGAVQHRLGEHRAAIGRYREALALFVQLGDRISQADTLGRLGETLLATGDIEAVRDAWRRALALLEEVGHPGVAAARARLAGLDAQG